MHPVLFGDVHAYPACIVLAIIVGIALLPVSARRAGVALSGAVWVPMLCLAVPALLGAKLYAVVERGGHWYGLSWELQNGLRYPGAPVGLAFGLALLRCTPWRRIGLAALADVIVPPVLVSLAVQRLGCLLEGCCHGWPSGLPWAVRFPLGSHAWTAHVTRGLLAPNAPASLPVHPLQLYFGLLALVVGGGLLWFQRRRTYDGQVVLLYLVLHESGKALLEFLRDGPTVHVQLWSLAFALAGGCMLLGRAAFLGSRSARTESEQPAATAPATVSGR